MTGERVLECYSELTEFREVGCTAVIDDVFAGGSFHLTGFRVEEVDVFC